MFYFGDLIKLLLTPFPFCFSLTGICKRSESLIVAKVKCLSFVKNRCICILAPFCKFEVGCKFWDLNVVNFMFL